jgi:hypothetical protein
VAHVEGLNSNSGTPPPPKKKVKESRWLTPVIPATEEAEMRRIEVQSQPRQIIFETLS